MGSAVICPGCRQRINISPEMTGQNVSCPMCKSQLTIGDLPEDANQNRPTPSATKTPADEQTDYGHLASFEQPGAFPKSGHESRYGEQLFSNEQHNSGSNALFWILGVLVCGGLLVLAVGLIGVLLFNRTIDVIPVKPSPEPERQNLLDAPEEGIPPVLKKESN